MADLPNQLAIPSPHLCDILVVAEYLSDKDERGALTSPIGHVFRGWMRDAHLDAGLRIEYTSVIRGATLAQALTKDKSLAEKGTRSITRGKYLRKEYTPNITQLVALVNKLNPKIIIALGDVGLWALTEEKTFKYARGRICEGRASIGRRKVLPTFSPMQVMAEYSNRPILLADLGKARREAAFAEVRRPQRFIHTRPTIPELMEFYNTYLKDAPSLSVDIETKGTQITCVGFSPNRERALVVPFFDEEKPDGNYWPTPSQEQLAWGFVRMVLRSKPCFGQNFQYDMTYLWRELGIPCPKFCDDTMLLHHALQPEMQKGLGFLASIYTDELAWKFMHKVSASDREAKQGDIE